jgi:succinyl-diaminopimelate desuccinylase
MNKTPTDPLPILQELVRCPSVTPQEAGALDYLEKLLGSMGFQCERLVFQAENTPDVDNLFARWGQKRPHLCFAGHADVVPPGDVKDWTHPPFSAFQDGKHLYGRGATDMKGAIAAFIAAVSDWKGGLDDKPPGSVSFLITGDEEGPAINGTAKVLQWMKENGHIPDHCIVGEPGSVDVLGDTIKIGRRGSMSFTVTVEGKQGHVAYPHKADNPIPKLVRFLDRIASAKLDDGNEHFEPSTLALSTVDVANPSPNIIPARATARFNIRFNTEHTFESLRAWVDSHAAAVTAELGGAFKVESSGRSEAFITEPGAFVGLVLDAVEQETGVVAKLSTAGGTSDARFIKDYCPVLEFGPTNATIHQVDERIDIAELRATAGVYRAIIERYFNSQP